MLNFWYCHRFPMKHLLHFNKLWTICHFISMQTTYVACIWRFFYSFWLGCATFMVTTVVYFFFFLRVSTLWFVIPQFVQCLSIFHVLFSVFIYVAYSIIYGTKDAFLVSIVVMFSSHNIVTSLCYCSVDFFILSIVILRHNFKHVLNTIVRKLFMVGICKPWASYEFAHSKPPPFQSLHVSYFSIPCIFSHYFEYFDDICKMLV
jgi:hypothetical protein